MGQIFVKILFIAISDMTYVLGFGSLWGALRIGDILPWDIDIDIRKLNLNYVKQFLEFSEFIYFWDYQPNRWTILPAVVIVDRNSDIRGTIDGLIVEMKEQGMDVYYRDWVGIIQGYSPVYKSQVWPIHDKFINPFIFEALFCLLTFHECLFYQALHTT